MLVIYGLGNWLETMKCQGYYQKNNSFKLITKHEKKLRKKNQVWEPIQQKYKVNENTSR